MPLHRRLPKRGFTRPVGKKSKFHILDIGKLIQHYASDEQISTKSLVEKGLIKSSLQRFKIIGEIPAGKKVAVEENLNLSVKLRKSVDF